MAISGYFAPTYFSPFFFAPLVATQAPLVAASMPYGDRDAFEAVLALLRSTGAFERVLFENLFDRDRHNSATGPLVSLVPEGWEEFDDVDPASLLRRVDFSLSLLVRDDEPSTRFDRLARLEAAVHDAIQGADLGGCLPGLTRVRRGRYDPRSLHPEQILRLDGEFTYMNNPNSSAS